MLGQSAPVFKMALHHVGYHNERHAARVRLCVATRDTNTTTMASVARLPCMSPAAVSLTQAPNRRLRHRHLTSAPHQRHRRGVSARFSSEAGKPPTPALDPTLYVKRTLRGGQVIRHPGTVVVLGDVNPDSEIVAGGDVFVWGSLRGDVTAGANGDESAQIFSLDMRPSSVTIGDVAALGLSADPSGGGGEDANEDRATGFPEVAAVDKSVKEIVVTPGNAAAANLAREVGAAESRRTSGSLARKTAYLTGVYIAIAGVALLLKPAAVFGLLFNIEAITDAWIRVFGVLCVAFGTYYWGTAYGDWLGRAVQVEPGVDPACLVYVSTGTRWGGAG